MDVPDIDFNKMRQYDFAIAGEALEVYEFKAEESIFSSFTVDITIANLNKMTIDDYIGKEALFTMIGRKTDRYFHGFVSTFTQAEPVGRYYIYKARVVPLFWKLNLISDVRIFQNKTTREIVEEVLEGSGILSNMFEFREHGDYSPREYCVQYRETNMAFISRLLAEEGMFYYFEFTKENHLLIIGDMHACHNYIDGEKEVLYSTPGQLVNQVEHVTQFDFSKNVTSGKATLKDYHFKVPSYLPEAEKTGELYDDLELYDYPGYLTDAPTEFRLADVTLERAIVEQDVVLGKSICRRFTPGHIFTLTDHEDKVLNAEYVLTRIKHEGKQPQALRELADANEGNTYGNSFHCISGFTNFRPEKQIKPSVMGIQTAIVTGPAEEEIHVDEYGRIKVQFYWDRLGKHDEHTTCWMRVSQPWAGSGWGTVFIPRIGQEVVVSFIDGDPDRPIVTGALYNGANMPPYSLPADKTKSTIKTNSTKDGGGFNELCFEDKKGEEEIYLQGEKDWRIDIKNDKSQHVGHDETHAVDNDRSKTVGNDQKESIGNNKDITVAKNHTESVGENSSHKIGKNSDESVAENKTVDIGKNRKEAIGEDSTINIGKNNTFSVADDSKVSIGKNLTETIGKDLTADIADNTSVSIGKDLSVMIGKNTEVTSGDQITFTCGSSSIVMKKDGTIQITGVDIKINASGKLVNLGMNISGN